MEEGGWIASQLYLWRPYFKTEVNHNLLIHDFRERFSETIRSETGRDELWRLAGDSDGVLKSMLEMTFVQKVGGWVASRPSSKMSLFTEQKIVKARSRG